MRFFFVFLDARDGIATIGDAGYTGFVGIEYEGSKLTEADGIKATKKLLEKTRSNK